MSGAYSFDYPAVLLGLAVLIPLAFYNNFSPLNKRIRKKLPRPLRKRLFLSKIFFHLSLAFIIIALAGPRWGTGRRTTEFRRGLDAVIALDLSRSMDVMDGSGEEEISRLGRGLSIVLDAVTAMPEIRYAAAIGKNRGAIAIPLTHDNRTVVDFLETLDTSSITGHGTNLENLINAAAGAFQASHPSARVIVLVSDGETLSGTPKTALVRCNEKGIAITAIAVGSEYGGEVPGGEGIISRRDLSAMKAAAGQTGGIFIDGNRRDAAQALIAGLHSLAPESETSDISGEDGARWFLFAVLALAALGASKLCLLKMRNEK